MALYWSIWERVFGRRITDELASRNTRPKTSSHIDQHSAITLLLYPDKEKHNDQIQSQKCKILLTKKSNIVILKIWFFRTFLAKHNVANSIKRSLKSHSGQSESRSWTQVWCNDVTGETHWCLLWQDYAHSKNWKFPETFLTKDQDRGLDLLWAQCDLQLLLIELVTIWKKMGMLSTKLDTCIQQDKAQQSATSAPGLFYYKIVNFVPKGARFLLWSSLPYWTSRWFHYARSLWRQMSIVNGSKIIYGKVYVIKLFSAIFIDGTKAGFDKINVSLFAPPWRHFSSSAGVRLGKHCWLPFLFLGVQTARYAGIDDIRPPKCLVNLQLACMNSRLRLAMNGL